MVRAKMVVLRWAGSSTLKNLNLYESNAALDIILALLCLD